MKFFLELLGIFAFLVGFWLLWALANYMTMGYL